MKYILLAVSLGLLAPASAVAEQPGLSTNTILSGPIYGGGVSKEQQRLSLGSLNSDLFVGRKRSSKAAVKKRKKRR